MIEALEPEEGRVESPSDEKIKELIVRLHVPIDEEEGGGLLLLGMKHQKAIKAKAREAVGEVRQKDAAREEARQKEAAIARLSHLAHIDIINRANEGRLSEIEVKAWKEAGVL